MSAAREKRKPLFRREPAFVELYGRPALGVVTEYLRHAPRVPEGGGCWLAVDRIARRRRAHTSDLMEALKRLTVDRVLIVETLGGRTDVRITGWHPERMPRVSAVEPHVGDTLKVGPRVATLTWIGLMEIAIAWGPGKVRTYKPGWWKRAARRATRDAAKVSR